MKTSTTLSIVSLLGLALVTSCVSNLESANYEPPEVEGYSAGVGRQIYVDSCKRCHDYPRIMEEVEIGSDTLLRPRYTAAQWETVLADKDHYALMSADARTAVQSYVAAAGR